MENLNEFKEFYLKSVISNLKSYYVYFNEENFDLAINELIDKFYQTYQINPFQISDPQEISNKLKEGKEPFESYSKSKGTNIPKAILNTHYVNFLKYQSEINFNSLQDFIDKLNIAFGSFCQTFQKERIGFNGNSRVASNSEIFGASRDNYWTINIGSEQELQYHIFKENDKIGYGLGFNAQKSRNNLTPVENVEKFISSFIQNKREIERNLSDYSFYNSSINDLLNIKEGDFVLYGKTFSCTSIGNSFILKKFDFLNIYYDLRYKQFNAYKEIYDSAIKNPKSITQVIQINKMETLLQYKKQIILQGPPGTGKTREAKLIAKEILGLNSTDDLKDNEQFKLIQFHPSYTYEDFVRGIVAKPNPDGEGIIYEAENKTLGDFATKALDNFLASKGQLTIDSEFQTRFNTLIDEINSEINSGKIFKFGDKSTAEIISVGNEYLIYSFPERKEIRYKLLFSDIEKVYNKRQEINIPIDLRDKEKELGLQMKGKYPYYFMILKSLEKIELPENFNLENSDVEEKPYILVIDEINRANLSSVLGELIYALEYRGEEVESMYEVDGSQKLILPPNLYIIGTMNTADRSVGHIDYAIRRRFAFVEVPPKDLSSEMGDGEFYTDLFSAVKALFTKDEYQTKSDFISQEFEPKDVALGHSYFIDKTEEGGDKKTRWHYEIKPILLEYIRDGVLKESALEQIAFIEKSIDLKI